MFVKIGEAVISNIDYQSDSFMPEFILEKFKKTASDLKKIAPKANDFLYFSCVMMHAAEASALEDDGTFKKTSSGEDVKVGWSDGWKWMSNDPRIKPYKNSRGDIFPESELVKAHKDWVGKPLCIDHQSQSVDHTRGFIVDTYYDDKLKRVVALCALDKLNYPDLARKVSTKYSNCVSMGTAVGRAVCTEDGCHKVAKVESDFCDHMKYKSGYGEINLDLHPIELSIVVAGADGKAKIKNIIAAANNLDKYLDSKKENLLQKLSGQDVEDIKNDIKVVLNKLDTIKTANHQVLDISDNKKITNLEDEIKFIKEKIMAMAEEKNMEKNAFFQGGGGVNEPTPGKTKYEVDPLNNQIRKNDRYMQVDDIGSPEDLHPGTKSSGMSELERKKMLSRASERSERRKKALEAATARQKEAYHQGGGGVNEPAANGKTKYAPDKGAGTLNDKHMKGQKPFPGVGNVDGLYPGPQSVKMDELKRKQMLSRASLRAAFSKSANNEKCWEVYSDENLILRASVKDIILSNPEMSYSQIASKEFGHKLINQIKSYGTDSVIDLFKLAQDPMAVAPAAPAPVAPAMPEQPEAMVQEMPQEGLEGIDDDGSAGDPKEVALNLAEKVRDLSSDLTEAVKALTGEQEEMGQLENLTPEPQDQNPEAVKAASENFAVLINVKKDMHKGLLQSMKSCLASLGSQLSELDLYANIGDFKNSPESQQVLSSYAQDTFKDVNATIKNATDNLKAFVNYSKATNYLYSLAQESNLEPSDEDLDDLDISSILDEAEYGDGNMSDLDNLDCDEGMSDDMGFAIDDLDEELESLTNDLDLGSDYDSDSDLYSDLDSDFEDETPDLDDELYMGDDEGFADVKVKTPKGDEVVVPTGSYVSQASMDLNSAKGRASFRAKLAQEFKGKLDLIQKAHPKGGVDFNVQSSNGLSHIEDTYETHDKIMAIIKSNPKAKKEADNIHALVSNGSLDADSVDDLVNHNINQVAIDIYKAVYANDKVGKNFAKELAIASAPSHDESLEKLSIKLASAWETTNEMVAKGMVANTAESKKAQVDQLMKFNDEAFMSLKSIIAKTEGSSNALRMPQVGLIEAGNEAGIKKEASEALSDFDVWSQYLGKKHRGF